MIYLDNNATTQIDPEVVQAMVDDFALGPANASSQHSVGRSASERLDAAIIAMGACLGSDLTVPGGPRMILTSGGTEANNLAVLGLGEQDNTPLVVSQIEHASVLEVAQHQRECGRVVRFVPVDCQGLVELDALDSILAELEHPGVVVSIMSANNESGVVEPIDQIANICRQARAILHVDATQSFGKVAFSLAEPAVSAVTITSHKFHGPAGIGALWINSGVKLRPQLFGGAQQLLSRPGTESVALAVGMSLALQMSVEKLSESCQFMIGLRDHFEAELIRNIDQLTIHAKDVTRLPSTTYASFPGIDRQSMLMALDFAGVACSSGAACSSGSSPPSHVLGAMKCPENLLRSAIRFGNSRFSTKLDIDNAIDRICSVYNRLRLK